MADILPKATAQPEQIKYYKYVKSRVPGGPGRLSVGLITASGLILLQIKGPGSQGREHGCESARTRWIDTPVDRYSHSGNEEGKSMVLFLSRGAYL